MSSGPVTHTATLVPVLRCSGRLETVTSSLGEPRYVPCWKIGSLANPSDYPRPMSNESMIEVAADEVRVLADQLRANPPDDLVRVGAVNGVLIAEWTCSGTTNKVGPSVTKNLP